MKGTLTWLSVISDPPTSGGGGGSSPYRQTKRDESKKTRGQKEKRSTRGEEEQMCWLRAKKWERPKERQGEQAGWEVRGRGLEEGQGSGRGKTTGDPSNRWYREVDGSVSAIEKKKKKVKGKTLYDWLGVFECGQRMAKHKRLTLFEICRLLITCKPRYCIHWELWPGLPWHVNKQPVK